MIFIQCYSHYACKQNDKEELLSKKFFSSFNLFILYHGKNSPLMFEVNTICKFSVQQTILDKQSYAIQPHPVQHTFYKFILSKTSINFSSK